MEQDKVTYFAESDHRNQQKRFGIKASDRTRHMYVIGKTGMGKSTMLRNMAIQDIQNGNGLALIDPHGELAEELLDFVPEERIKDVLYFAPFDLDHPISFNVMEDVGPDKRHLVANGLMSAFKKIWVDMWSARMEYILNNILLALLEYPDSTLIGVNRMLADKTYRNKVIANITDVSVKSFWEDEFAKYGERYMQEAGAAIQNKIGQFISNPLVRNIIGQPHSSFDVREIMDEKKIILINLSKGKVGEDNANLIGSMIITKIYLAAMSRADVTLSELAKLPNFYFYVDEFQSFANESFADILSEARKYKLNLTIAHQYVEQMTDEVRAAVFGNVGTMIAFRVGSYDADIFEKEFAPEFTAEDMVNLGFAQIYLKLMINGIGSRPFSARTIGPIRAAEVSYKDAVISHTRGAFAKPKSEVEDIILRWHESHSGLLDDPQVDKARAKAAEEGVGVKEMRKKEAERQRRESLEQNRANNSGKSGGGSRGGQNRSGGGRDSGRSSRDNRNRNNRGGGGDDKIQKAISLRQLQHKEEEDRENKKKNQDKNNKNNFALRDALAGVLKDSQKGVEQQMKEMKEEVRKVKEGDVQVGKIFKKLEQQTIESASKVPVKKKEDGIREIPRPELEKMLEVGPVPGKKVVKNKE